MFLTFFKVVAGLILYKPIIIIGDEMIFSKVYCIERKNKAAIFNASANEIITTHLGGKTL